MRGTLVAAILAALVAAVAAAAAADPYTDQGWAFKKEADGIRIYNREKPGSDIKELLAITVVDFPTWRLFAVVQDYDRFKDFMPYTVVSKLLAEEKSSDKKAFHYFFTALDLPLVSNRYYTLRLTDESDADGRTGVCRSAWTLSREPGPDPAWDDPQVKDLFPKNFSKPIKTPTNDGYWLFEPQEPGRSRITYYVYTDPGGKIPPSVANLANSIAIPKLMAGLKKRAKDPMYDKFAPREGAGNETTAQ
jgi:ribosome-associated toxin RatA of RatAB toxin-antitoxin module